MFFSLELLSRGGKFFTVWVAATRGIGMLTNKQAMETDIALMCSEIAQLVMSESRRRHARLSLVLSSKLINGVLRIYARQVDIMFKEVNVLRITLHEPLFVKEYEMLTSSEDVATDTSNDVPKIVTKKKKKILKKTVDSDELFAELMTFSDVAGSRVVETLQTAADNRPHTDITLKEPTVPPRAVEPVLDEFDFGIERDTEFISRIMEKDLTKEDAEKLVLHAPESQRQTITVVADVHPVEKSRRSTATQKRIERQPVQQLPTELPLVEELAEVAPIEQTLAKQVAEQPPVEQAAEQPVAEEARVQPAAESTATEIQLAATRKKTVKPVTKQPKALPNQLLIFIRDRKHTVKEFSDDSDLVKEFPDPNDDLLRSLKSCDPKRDFINIDDMLEVFILQELARPGTTRGSTVLSENLSKVSSRDNKVSSLPSISEIPMEVETFLPPMISTPQMPTIELAPIMPGIEETPIQSVPMIPQVDPVPTMPSQVQSASSMIPQVESVPSMLSLPDMEIPDTTPKRRKLHEKVKRFLDNEPGLQQTMKLIRECHEMERTPVTLEDVTIRPLTKRSVSVAFMNLLDLGKMGYVSLHAKENSIEFSHVELISRPNL